MPNIFTVRQIISKLITSRFNDGIFHLTKDARFYINSIHSEEAQCFLEVGKDGRVNSMTVLNHRFYNAMYKMKEDGLLEHGVHGQFKITLLPEEVSKERIWQPPKVDGIIPKIESALANNDNEYNDLVKKITDSITILESCGGVVSLPPEVAYAIKVLFVAKKKVEKTKKFSMKCKDGQFFLPPLSGWED